VRNEGEAPWPEQTELTFVGGDRLGAHETVPVQALPAPAQEVDVAVDMIAPSAPGRYTGYWKLAGPFGVRFGQRIWVDINVENAAPASAAPIPPVEVVPEVVANGSSAMAVDTMAVDSVPAPAPAPVPIQESTTPHEVEALKSLVEMGFHGDLLAVLRKNKGDLLASIRELLAK